MTEMISYKYIDKEVLKEMNTQNREIQSVK